MLFSVKNGQTSNAFRVKLRDSSQTDGRGLTGLTNASSGLVISTIADNEATATAYTVAGSNVETIATLGTFAAPTSGKCRFKEVDATNHPGLYELQIADARFAVSNAKRLVISISGATNLAQCDVLVLLTTVDPYDGTRGGMTALPNAAAGANGGLPVLSNSAADLAYSVKVSVGTGAGQINLSSGKVPATLASTDVTGNVAADVQTIKTQTVTCSGGVTVPAATLASTTNITAASGVAVASIATDAVNAAALATDAVTEIAGAILLTPTNKIATNASNEVTAASVTGNVGGSVNSVSTGVTVATNNDKTGYALTVTPPTAATIAAAVRDVNNTSPAASSLGAAVNSAAAAGDPLSSAVPGSYASGTAGYALGTYLNSPVAAVGTSAASAATSAAAAATSAASAATTATAINAKLGTPAGASVSADLAAVPSANANADALLNRNVLGGSSTGRTVKEALAALRNKVAVSGTTMNVYSTDDLTVLWSATVTDAPGADPISAIDPA